MALEDEVEWLGEAPLEDLCRYLGTRVRRHRAQTKQSQADFAHAAGIPLRTFKRLETHGQASLRTFVLVLQAMGRARYLPLLFPQPVATTIPSSLQDRVRLMAERAMLKSESAGRSKPHKG
jgi:hypothetical protein